VRRCPKQQVAGCRLVKQLVYVCIWGRRVRWPVLLTAPFYAGGSGVCGDERVLKGSGAA